eukprot:COSAG05_NODE_6988_length_870_cov_1.428016_2_plen_128_part_00
MGSDNSGKGQDSPGLLRTVFRALLRRCVAYIHRTASVVLACAPPHRCGGNTPLLSRHRAPPPIVLTRLVSRSLCMALFLLVAFLVWAYVNQIRLTLGGVEIFSVSVQPSKARGRTRTERTGYAARAG